MTEQIGHYKLWEGYRKRHPKFQGPVIEPTWGRPFDVTIKKEMEEMPEEKPFEKLVKAIEQEDVHHPQHYGGEDDPYETIKVLEAKLSYEEFIGFCKGNAIKYLDRANHKQFPFKDYKKSEWYLNRMNAFIKRKDAE